MRTTLDLPEELLNEARELTGRVSKTDTIVYALKEVIRRQKIEALKAMFGTVTLALDLDKIRGRHRAPTS
jgi:hypothetical protein